MKFQYFTYFLNPIKQLSLFTDHRDKNEIFRDVMKINSEFQNRKSSMAYRFLQEQGHFIHAKLGKESSIKRRTLSEVDIAEEIESDYPYCNVLINFDNTPETGQRIAFEYDSTVFLNPRTQLEALENHINTTLTGYGYVLSIHPIIDQREFWTLAKTYEGRIERLRFSYAVPNLFNLENNLNDDLKASGETYQATNAVIEFENKAGLLKIPEDDFMKQSAEYTGRGGGKYTLKIKGLKTEISSDKNVKTRTIEDLDLNASDSETFNTVIQQIFN